MRSVLLLSGGIDSFAAGRFAQEMGSELYAVTFDYGQVNRRELSAAGRVSQALGVCRSHVMTLDLGLGAYGRSSLLAAPRGVACAPATGDFGNYVPARHAIFLSCALGLAEVVGANDIVIGASGRAMGLRRSMHRDCQPAFFQAFQAMANEATDIGTGIEIICPLMDLTKGDIIAYALDQRLDLGLTWTCHAGGERQCGTCRTCQLRLEAFHSLEIEDPVSYELGAAHWIERYRQGWLESAGAGPTGEAKRGAPSARPVWRRFP
jgi:7-cyano-7-deazaguanine synthase